VGNDNGPTGQRRLDSWKEIGAYFGRDERTVKRWERERGLPVHRVPGSGRGRVYAYAEELTEWLQRADVSDELGAGKTELPEEATAELEGPPAMTPSVARPPVSTSNGVQEFPPLTFVHSSESTARVAENAPRLSLVQRSARPAAGTDTAGGSVAASVPAVSTAGGAPAAGAGGARPGAISRNLWIFAACCVIALAGAGFGWHEYNQRRAAELAQSAATAMNSAANAQAENLYLQGKFFWQQRTPESLAKAVDLFTQAIVHDPHYAPAYAGLAECYELLREFSNMPDSEAFPRALSAAQQAVQLNPNLAQGHAALAFALFYWSWDTKRAMQEFDLALRLDPNAAQTHHWYATCLMSLGEGKQALVQIDRARQLDPGSRAILADKGWILGEMNQLDEARKLLEQVVQAEPDFYSGHDYLAWVAYRQGDGATFASEMRQTGALVHDPLRAELADTAAAGFKQGGAPAMRKAVDDRTRNQYKEGKVGPVAMADLLVKQGDLDGAFKLLDDGYARRDPELRFLLLSPEWVPYRGDARFVALQRKLGVG
jgi:Tfp pilus assembly protein PilF